MLIYVYLGINYRKLSKPYGKVRSQFILMIWQSLVPIDFLFHTEDLNGDMAVTVNR